MEKAIYTKIQKKKNNNEKALAILIDPDKCEDRVGLLKLIHLCVECNVDLLLVGGSLITSNRTTETIQLIKENSKIPVVIFPGNFMHINPEADAILFLSLLSGRNPDLLIGQQVIAAPLLKQNCQIEVISTGYLLIDAGAPTTALYMSQSMPIPHDKPDIAMSTALAAQYLGFSCVYLDAGSGAKIPVSKNMIAKVKAEIDIPLIVGGGLDNPEKVADAYNAGADIIVLGNGIEKTPDLLIEVSYLNKST
ncbi:MAG: geranylgeranylglyceryl/heptaprenylglyceryl phosphate synthase [Cyclobacteriaceae bacterium]